MKLRWIFIGLIGIVSSIWGVIKDNKNIFIYFITFGLFLWISSKIFIKVANKTRVGPE